MKMFDIDDNTMINLECVEFVKFDKVGGEKVVVVGVGGTSFIVSIDKHKELFRELIGLGVSSTKQFVSL